MRVLGIDPGSRILGYGIVESSGAGIRRVTSGILRPPSTEPRPERLRLLLHELRDLFRIQPVDEVAVEDAFFGAGPRSCLRLGESRGVVLAACAEASRPVFEYAPARVKKTVTGAGSAAKARVADVVRGLLGGYESTGPSDESDALAVAICHVLRAEDFGGGSAAPAGREALLARIGRRRPRRSRTAIRRLLRGGGTPSLPPGSRIVRAVASRGVRNHRVGLQ